MALEKRQKAHFGKDDDSRDDESFKNNTMRDIC